MVTTLNFKSIIDLPKWRPLAQPIVTGTSIFGLTSDLRNNEDRHPLIYVNAGTSTFHAYSVKSDEWLILGSPGLGGSGFTCGFFMSAQGPRGTIAAGATTTSFILTTALPAGVGINQLANRGDGRGFKVRIIGNSAGSSGLTEERLVIANTSGTTPTIVVDSPFSFTPANGDTYEFLSGRLFIMSTNPSAGGWKYYDVLTNSFSGNLSTTNSGITSTNNVLVGLDELLVPYNRSPGEGFFGVLTATASGAASLTGQAVGGDAGVVINQYRNFQIRIIQDVAIPTAVGQRINITSHTAGPSPVYTVPAWAVTPSANAIYVIENNGDRILAWHNAAITTNTYMISTDTWDAGATFANRTGGAVGVSGFMTFQAFSIESDSGSPPNARQSFIYQFRGGGANTLDIFDIAGAATGTWTNAITYGNQNQTFTTAASAIQDPATNQGRYTYIYVGASSQRFYRFDMKNNILENSTFLRIPTGAAGNQVIKLLAQTVFVDGNTKLSFIFFITVNSLGSGSPQLFFGLPITN
jgi:hypothetical protein